MAYQSINPTTGEIVATFPTQSDAEVLQALADADACYRSDWRLRPVAERARIVARAAALLRERADEFAAYATLEMGKLIEQSRYEVELSASILDYYAEHAEAFLKPHTLPDAASSTVITEPLGVIFAIEPWNFPYYQLARVAAPQIMAGNVLMVKHASNVPQCALAFARLFEDAGAPEGVYTNLFCSIDQVGALIDDFRIRGVTLTGSERAGATVAERAGKNIKKAVLELGGSDPFIVLEDAPLDAALDSAASGRMINMGQACVASKRFIVVGQQRGQEFLDGLIERMGGLLVGDPTESKTSLGPLVSEKAVEELLGQIHSAQAHGARVVLGGKRINRAGFYLEPTIITDITEDNPLFQQETFGPVASVYIVENEDEAIRLANATSFGLGASVFTSDIDKARRIAGYIDSGMVFINSGAYSGPEVPFGGVKNSGYGRELSELGFGEFVNRKLIRIAPHS